MGKRRTIAGSGVAAVAVAFSLSACGGTETQTITVVRTETVTQTETVEVPAAPDATATEPTEPSQDGSGTPKGATIRTVGGTGIDDGVSFRVLSLNEVTSFPTAEYSDPVRAVSGAKLVRADVVVKNNTSQPFSPICSGNAVLVDTKGRNYNLHDDDLSVAGSNLCKDIAPGFQSTLILSFQIPNDSKIAGLALWNSDAPDDYAGESYVLFQKQ